MTISVNVFDSAEIKEDQTTEFKTSIFVDPETRTAGGRQMRTIAETLAAFMNADGGMLYVGIADDKQIRGIEGDLRILATDQSSVVVRSPRGNDETLLVKLNEVDASKFDGITSDPFFSKKWFVEVQPHKRYPDYYKDKLGTSANVRGYCKINKTYFTKPEYVVRRLLDRCGIVPSRIAVRA